MTLPNLELPIEDQHTAEWWRNEFAGRFSDTNDHAFEEAHQLVVEYIDRMWPGRDEL